ncbi:MAG: hypothetical protein WBN66_13590, partial [Smithella sp.]
AHFTGAFKYRSQRTRGTYQQPAEFIRLTLGQQWHNILTQNQITSRSSVLHTISLQRIQQDRVLKRLAVGFFFHWIRPAYLLFCSYY